MSLNNRGERPVAIRAPSGMPPDDRAALLTHVDTTPRARCRRCHHPLTAPMSVRLELGPTCRRIELGEVAA